MLINSESLQALKTSFSAVFQKAFAGTERKLDAIATTVQSSTASNTYGWLGSIPGMREWIGDKHINQLESHGYTIVNKNFENTVGVKRNDIEDDNIGLYNPLMETLAYEAAVHPDKLVFDLLKDGDKNKCFDGQNFFDNDHEVAGKSVTNIYVGSKPKWILLDTSRPLKPMIYQIRKKPVFVSIDDLKDSTVFTKGTYLYGVEARSNAGYGFWQMAAMSTEELTSDNADKVRMGMRTLKSETGNSLGIKPDTIVVSPELESTAEKLFNMRTLAGGGDNPDYQRYKVIVADSW